MTERNGGRGEIDPAWRRAVHDYPLPMMIIDLLEHEAVGVNGLCLARFAIREGHPVKLVDRFKLDARHRRLADLVQSGTVDSFEAPVSTRRAGGPPMKLRVWVHALDRKSSPRRFAVVAVTAGGDIDPNIRPPMTRPRAMVAGATDAEWSCERVTREVT